MTYEVSNQKNLALISAAGLMLTALAACTQKTKQDVKSNDTLAATTSASVAEGSKDKGKEPVTLNFWHHYSAQSKENETLMKVLIPKFEQENPNYKINAVPHDWAGLHDKLLISASSNSLPDVARLDIAWLPELQKLGILAELDKEMPDFSKVKESLLPSALSTAKIKDNYYALPLNTNTKILFYNVAALEQAGLKVPQTMEELVEAAKKVSGKNQNGQQVWALNEPALSGWNVLPWIWSNGGDICDENYSKASGILNGTDTVAAVQMLADMYKNKQFTGFNNGDIPMTDGFGTGRYLMLLEGPWKTAELKGAYPDFKYATSQIPAGKKGSISVLGGEDIAMFKTANKEAACKFLEFMTSEFAQTEMAKCGQIPVNKAALASDVVKQSDYAPFIEAIKTAKARPQVASWTEIDNRLQSTMTAIIKDGAEVKASLDKLAKEVDELLAK